MTTIKKNVPAQAATCNEDLSIRERSTDHPTVLRLHRRGWDTGVSYGTEAGDKLPHGEWWPVLIPVAAIHAALKGSVPVTVSLEDVDAQSARARKARRKATIDARVRERIGELEDTIRAEVTAELEKGEGK